MNKLTKSIILFSLLPVNTSNSFANDSNTNILCQDLISSSEVTLNGEWFGFREGALDRFSPENSSDETYLNDLYTITEFIEDYSPNSCGNGERGNQMYYDCIESLINNMNSENDTARDIIRSKLEDLEITNYFEKIKQLSEISQEVISRAQSLESAYNSRDISESEFSKQKSYLENYLEQIELQAKYFTNLALITRELPPGQEGEISYEDLSDGINHANKAYDHLVELSESLDKKDWNNLFENFYNWKKEYSEAFLQLLEVQETALQNAEFQVATQTSIGDQWHRIMFHDFNGEWQAGYASQEFFSDWGQNGTNYYSQVESIVEIRENFEELSQQPIIENPCGNSSLYGKYLWDLGDCDYGLIFRENCSVGIIEPNGRPKRDIDLTYDNNQVIRHFKEGRIIVLYTFDSESRFINGRKQYSNWEKANELLDKNNTYTSNEWQDRACDLAEIETCMIWIEMDRPYPTRDLCQQELAPMWDREEF